MRSYGDTAVLKWAVHVSQGFISGLIFWRGGGGGGWGGAQLSEHIGHDDGCA